jgi:hypothetical protein
MTAFAFFAANTGVSHAYGIDASNTLQHGAAVSGGSAAMLSLRIPLGGEASTRSQPVFALNFGSTWIDAPGAPNLASYRFVPSAELGMTLNSAPILRLGAFDMTPNEVNLWITEAQGRSFCDRNIALCLIGVAAIAGVLLYRIGHVDRSKFDPCEGGCYNGAAPAVIRRRGRLPAQAAGGGHGGL